MSSMSSSLEHVSRGARSDVQGFAAIAGSAKHIRVYQMLSGIRSAEDSVLMYVLTPPCNTCPEAGDAATAGPAKDT